MKIREMFRLMHDVPAVVPYFEYHLDIQFMTEREFIRVLEFMQDLREKTNVVTG